MRRGLPRTAGGLVAAGILVGSALFFSDGSSYAPVAVIGGLAILVAGAGLVLGCWPAVPLARPDSVGLAFFGLLAGLSTWTVLSILWSVEPDRSWEYFNRGVVYAAFAVLGLLAASGERAVERAALGGSVLFSAVVVWALAGKVIPDLFPDGERIARLRDPLGYWNALALVAAIAVLLGIWVASRTRFARSERVAGAVLGFLSTVTLLLTYSRGGVLVAAVVVLAFIALVPEQLQAAVAVTVGALPGLAVAAWAFTQDGIAKDGQPYDDRLSDGLQFGGVLVFGAALVATLALVLLRYEESHAGRLWRPQRRHWAVAGGAATVLAIVAVLVGSGGHPGGWIKQGFEEFASPTVGDSSTAARFGELSSNSRWDWWVESWDVFEEHPVRGSGAGSFDVARRPVRRNIIVVIEPHSLPLQFLSETGVVGLLLLLGLLSSGAAASVLAVRRLAGTERTAATVLALAALAYLLHALVDYDWDFLALTAPAMVIVGLLIGTGRPPVRAVRRPLLAAAAGLASLALAFSVVAPWLAVRKVEEAYAALDERDIQAARDAVAKARDLNPLSLDPIRAEAAVADREGNRQQALEHYAAAVELQPENWVTWYELARYEEDVGLRQAAIRHVQQAQRLDPLNPRLGPMLERLFNSR